MALGDSRRDSASSGWDDGYERALALTHRLHMKAEQGESIAAAAAAGLKEILGADACEIASVVRVAWMEQPRIQTHAIIGWNDEGEVMPPAVILSRRQDALMSGAAKGEQTQGVLSETSSCTTRRVDERASLDRECYEQSLKPLGLRWGVISTHAIPHPNEGIGMLRLWRKGERGAFQEEDERLVQHVHSTLGPWLWARLVGQLGRVSEHAGLMTAIQKLTPAQRGVLCHLLEGGTEAVIAKRIFRSRYTVHDHVRAIYQVLGVKNRVELVLMLTRSDPQIWVNGAMKGQAAALVSTREP